MKRQCKDHFKFILLQWLLTLGVVDVEGLVLLSSEGVDGAPAAAAGLSKKRCGVQGFLADESPLLISTAPACACHRSLLSIASSWCSHPQIHLPVIQMLCLSANMRGFMHRFDHRYEKCCEATCE